MSHADRNRSCPALAFLAVLAAGTPASAQGPMSGAEATITVSKSDLTSMIQDAVRGLLRDEPQILTDALSEAQAKQAAQNQAATAKALLSTAALVVTDPQIPRIGPAEGKPVVEFFDYNCHFCKDFSEKTFSTMRVSHPELRWDFVLTPVLGAGSLRLAQFAAAAQLQGRFEPVHHYLIERKGLVETAQDADALRDDLIRATGLDKARFDKALHDGSAKAMVDHHWTYVTRAGITGTPTFVVDNGYMPGFATPEQFAALLEAAAKAGSAAAGR